MKSETIGSLEGRLIAHRKILALLLEHCGDSGALRETLEARLEVQDHEEDPGVVPNEAFAIEGAIADELRLVMDAAKRG
ncbi:hypothetical protein [Amaricoccus macauensis]|uniref:hypothetical protein n=1 Tax=Amaricoccus macauensis TaxID=57001 RepID=UPI003C7E7749